MSDFSVHRKRASTPPYASPLASSSSETSHGSLLCNNTPRSNCKPLSRSESTSSNSLLFLADRHPCVVDPPTLLKDRLFVYACILLFFSREDVESVRLFPDFASDFAFVPYIENLVVDFSLLSPSSSSPQAAEQELAKLHQALSK